MYNEYFGFLESPFNVTPDPRFFYGAPAYLEAYANLRYGIQAKKGFIAITGEVGTGKTTLLRKLMRELEKTVHFALIFNTDLSFNEIFRAALRDLGLTPQTNDRLAMVDELNAYLLEQLKKGHIACLLIDEAQNLSDESLEELRLLSNLETDREKLLQIVLMGQPEIKTKLDKPNLRQLKQRIAIRCEIPPLKDEEVASYINFRLKVAGYNGKDLFGRDAVQEIARYSKGIPRLINIICDNALLITFAATQKTVSSRIIREVTGDLGLRSTPQPEPIQGVPPVPPKAEQDLVLRQRPNRISQRTITGRVRSEAGTFLAIVVSLVVFLVTDPETVVTNALTFLRFVKHNSQQWLLLINRPEIVRPKPFAEARNLPVEDEGHEVTKTDQRLTIQYGSTIYNIASDAYGANAVLGMDLIKEFNPQIQDANWISAGAELLLPILGPETLLRRQPDASYRLIMGSFLSRREADERARRILDQGYQVLITPKAISNNLILYRVEVDGLKDLRDAAKALELGVKNQWFTFPVKTATDGRQSQRDINY